MLARHHRHAGFTLVEMLIVVMIIAILAALAVAKLGDPDLMKLKSAATMLVADLGYAQVDSIGHADELRVVVFDTAAGSYHIAAATSPDEPVTDPLTKGPYRVTFGQGTALHLAGVTISATGTGGDDRIQFGVYGQLDQATAATITLSAGDNSLVLTIDPITGEVTVGSTQ